VPKNNPLRSLAKFPLLKTELKSNAPLIIDVVFVCDMLNKVIIDERTKKKLNRDTIGR
jgi:hypothetical protein